MLSSLLSVFRPSRKKPAAPRPNRKRRTILRVEALEDRLAPAALIVNDDGDAYRSTGADSGTLR